MDDQVRTERRMVVTGIVCDAPGDGSKLAFEIRHMDQSDVPLLVGSLAECEEASAMRGDHRS
jgi:hypothetical protein